MKLQERLRKVLNSWIGVVIIVIILFFLQLPYFFGVMPLVLALLFKIRFLCFLFLVFCLIVLGGGIRNILRQEILLWLCVGWSILMCISMYINGKSGAEIITMGKDFLLTSWIALLLLSVFSRVNVRRLVAALFFYYLIINTINNASVMFFCNSGIWIGPFGESNPEFVFFGHINEGVTCGLNSILFGSMYCLQYEKKWMPVLWVNIAYSICTACVIDCADQLFVYILAAVVILTALIAGKRSSECRTLRFINFRNIMILCVILVVGIIILVSTGWIERSGLYSLVHGRQEIWSVVLGSIREHPVLGNGYSSWFQAAMHYGDVKTFWHQHSFYFQVLYETGIVGALLYAGMFIACIRRSRLLKKQYIRFVMEVLIGIFFLALLVEVCIRSEIFLLLGTLYYLTGKNCNIQGICYND